MSRLIDRLTLLNRLGVMFVVASSFCVAPTFAQDAGGEDPSLEDNDEVVIEDEPIIDGEVIDEVVIEEVETLFDNVCEFLELYSQHIKQESAA